MSAEEAEKFLEEAFGQLNTYPDLLGVFMGSCSMLYQSGEFDTVRATQLHKAFTNRLQELMFAANVDGGAMSVDKFINRFFRSK